MEAWAWAYLHETELAAKLSPPPPPAVWEDTATPRRIGRPLRPRPLIAAPKRFKTPRGNALQHKSRRAQLLHTFLHHELQAAELMLWAVLAFPETPRSFKKGLLNIFADEIRHMGLYVDHLRRLGFDAGAFPINDWFWTRVPQAIDPAQFVATMGIGLEGANLDHAPKFAEAFERAGDLEAAQIQARIAREEAPHVAFAAHWFAKFRGPVTFDAWRSSLTPPLTPLMMRGDPFNRPLRKEAGLDDQFLDELTQWSPESSGS